MKRLKALDFPKSILIETINKCNGLCVFCPYRDLRSTQKTEYLSLSIIENLLTEISQYDVKRISLFNNNEPLLDDRIFGIIKYAKKRNPNSELTLSTNGRLLTKEIAETLFHNGLTTLYISIPALDEEEYRKLMQYDLQAVLQQINLIESSIIMKMIRIAVPMTYAYTEEDFKNYFNPLSMQVCAWPLEYKKSWNCANFNKKNNNDDIQHKPCDRCLDQAVILANGNMVLCCRDWREETIIGNVKYFSIEELWKSKSMVEYQNYIISNNYDSIALCRDCSENPNNTRNSNRIN